MSTAHAVEERPALGGAKKRITIISNFLHQAAGDESDPFLDAIVDRVNEKDIMLEIISIDVPEQDSQQQQAKNFNAGIIKRIMQQVLLLAFYTYRCLHGRVYCCSSDTTSAINIANRFRI